MRASAPPRPSPAAGEGWNAGARDRLERFAVEGQSGSTVYPGGIFGLTGPNTFYDDLRALLSASPTPPGGIDLSSAQASPTADAARVDASDGGTEAGRAGLGYERGSFVWLSSEDDGGPDVGIQVGLGKGFSLYCGELADATLRDHDVDPKEYSAGWWIVLYGPKDSWIIGAVPIESYVAQEAFEHIVGCLAPDAPTRPVADAGEGWQDIASAPKDGTEIDLWIVWLGDRAYRRTDARWDVEHVDWSLGQYRRQQYADPPEVTHWRPIPAPPHVAQTPEDISRAQSKPSDPASPDLAEGGK